MMRRCFQGEVATTVWNLHMLSMPRPAAAGLVQESSCRRAWAQAVHRRCLKAPSDQRSNVYKAPLMFQWARVCRRRSSQPELWWQLTEPAANLAEFTHRTSTLHHPRSIKCTYTVSDTASRVNRRFRQSLRPMPMVAAATR